MAKLIYSAITSLDLYVEDADGGFDWAAPDEEVHAFFNDLERPIGSYLYGRRMYQTMVFWETVDTTDEPAAMGDYAQLWRAADKIVFSRSLQTVGSARTRIETDFNLGAIRRLKQTSATNLSIGGAELAGQAIAAGLVDEIGLLIQPILVGGGKPALPANVRSGLDLIEERRFDSGVVYLRYRVGH
ncbi:deaminase [Microlunatus elymi]|uniref:Deaminase n=1 Tax=Microlunatus elymi TaxID=2596828 RepID=A0A516Q0H7_9ACTN|nr:dihydrofolate reductase family protein [Microlunatus elymi]QDP96939.1 deaminase [Microlunatus elymi]